MTVAVLHSFQVELCLAEPLLNLQDNNNNNDNDFDEECGVYHGESENSNSNINKKSLLFSVESAIKPVVYYPHVSVSFSLAQILIFLCLIIKYGAAPLVVNPLLGPGPDVLNYWGAKNSALILNEGEYIRVFTAMYLNYCLPQLVCNVCIQLTIMRMLEKQQHWGSGVTCFIFLFSGMTGFMMSAYLSSNSLSVGSFGGIMGIVGANTVQVLLFQFCSNGTDRIVREEDMAIAWASVALVVIEVLTGISYYPKNADWIAPIGGIVTGMLLGFARYVLSPLSKIHSYWTRTFALGCLIVLYVGVYWMSSLLFHKVSPPNELYNICAYCQSTYVNYKCIGE